MQELSYYPDWVLTHGPALLVVLPLMMAVITALSRSEKLAWGLTLFTAAVSIFLSAAALQHVFSIGPIDYAMGGWAPPMGISYHIDGLNAPVLLLISLIAFFLHTLCASERRRRGRA